MIDYDKKITELDKQEVQDYLQKGFKQYALDCSQSLPAEELSNLVIRAYNKLTEDYPNWTLANVKYTLTMALNDDESKFTKLTVKNMFIWMRKAKDQFMKKDRDDSLDKFEQAIQIINRTEEERRNDSLLWSAVAWKMKHFGAGKKYKIKEWYDFPLQHVAECLSKGMEPDDDLL